MNCSEFFKISLSFSKKNGFIFFSKPILEGRVISELDRNSSTFFEYFIRSRLLGLTDKANLRKEANKYLEIFKDHPYVFNLGHGILPETKIEMVEELVKIVRDFA